MLSPRPVPATILLRRLKNGSKTLPIISAGMPLPSSATRTDTYLPGFSEAPQRGLRRRETCPSHGDRHRALLLDCVARVDREVHDHAFELRGARPNLARLRLQLDAQGDLRAERSTQQRLELTHHLARVDHCRLDRLAARESEELLDQVRTALARVARRFDLFEYLRPVAKLLRDQVEVAHEHGQQIVEVVSDTGREAAERLHPRAVLHRRAQLRLVARVHEHAAQRTIRDLANVASQRDGRTAC